MAAQAIALAAFVAVVGMPHGGLDHRFGQMLIRPAVGQWWVVVFGTGYLAIMAVVLICWWLFPVATVVLFVALSAVHFGTAEMKSSLPGGLAQAMMQGGMVVWVPAFFQPVEFTRLLTWVVPQDRWPEDILFQTEVRVALGVMLMAVCVSAVATSFREGLRVLIFAMVFALAPPLVSFMAYFCGWHSMTELLLLARLANPTNLSIGLLRVVRETAPLAGLAVLFITIGWWAWASHLPLTSGLIQAVFVGLSTPSHK